ncbi:hypothetical protein PYW07_012350 [Mythimna separata]|uniref:G-protein coupled receptors family 1 profile domain-containing protein n=1 Tax=Mythimna separata TaxID=271217 RepID=A0AAD7YL10_MYTSE|nr:hypothetical protein PYW07_012350 [Mythimna separata]
MAACNYTGGVVGSKYGVQYNSSEELASVDLFQCYPDALLQFASACCVIFMLIGIPGNLTTIVALARYKKVRNATAIFIINLHTSDLIFNCFILPMTAVTFVKGSWTHGWVMCRLYAYFKFVLSSSSLSTVVAISINRYVIVCHPLLYPKLYTRRTISLIIFIIWAAAMAMFMAPNFGAMGRFDLEPNEGFCTMMPDLHGTSPKNIFVIGFALPYITIVLCYARIWWVVKAAKKVQSNNPRPTNLPLTQNQSDKVMDENTVTSCDPSSPESINTSDDDKEPKRTDSSVPQSPREENALVKYFKAPLRHTRKLVRRKVPTSRDKRLCAMIVAIMISHCFSHVPVMVTRLAYKEFRTKPVLNVFSHLLLFLGTCINPIIYVLMSKEYRQAYKSLFDCIIKKFSSSSQ